MSKCSNCQLSHKRVLQEEKSDCIHYIPFTLSAAYVIEYCPLSYIKPLPQATDSTISDYLAASPKGCPTCDERYYQRVESARSYQRKKRGPYKKK